MAGSAPGVGPALERELEQARAHHARLRAQVARTFLGHEEVLDHVLCAFYARGHVLLEGLPGLGKTTLMRALAAALRLSFRRIQFTPDLMPSDVLGTRIFEEDEHGRRRFRFERGPLFAELVLADEINRATPRTQAALLEAMQERQVTAFGESHALGPPFFLVATENPIEMEGTYPLPEAQLDRFMLKLELGFPSEAELVRVLAGESAPPAVEPVLERGAVLQIQELVSQVPVAPEVVRFAARLVLATQPARPGAPESVRQNVRAGASPRAGEALLAAARARAFAGGRLWVTPDDVAALAPAALRHRILLDFDAEARGVRPDDLVLDALASARARIE